MTCLFGCDSDPEPGNTDGTTTGAATSGTSGGVSATETDATQGDDDPQDQACFPQCFAPIECCSAYGLSGDRRTACEQAQGAYPFWRCPESRNECEPAQCSDDNECVEAQTGDTCDAGSCKFACSEISDCPDDSYDCLLGFCREPSVAQCQGDFREMTGADCSESFPICGDDGLCYDCDGDTP